MSETATLEITVEDLPTVQSRMAADGDGPTGDTGENKDG
jgi:hypothetical protein